MQESRLRPNCCFQRHQKLIQALSYISAQLVSVPSPRRQPWAPQHLVKVQLRKTTRRRQRPNIFRQKSRWQSPSHHSGGYSPVFLRPSRPSSSSGASESSLKDRRLSPERNELETRRSNHQNQRDFLYLRCKLDSNRASASAP